MFLNCVISDRQYAGQLDARQRCYVPVSNIDPCLSNELCSCGVTCKIIGNVEMWGRGACSFLGH